MLSAYQHLPEHINPVAVSVGFFSVKWYSVMYLVAFGVIYGLLRYRIKEYKVEEMQKSKIKNQNKLTNLLYDHDTLYKILDTKLLDLMIYVITGLLIGARLGYAIFYNLPYYLAHPLEIILPVQVVNYKLQVVGYYGMSYFGGLVGTLIAGIYFCKKNKINFWETADFIIPAIPAGYFFGRIGNFLNGELFGRVTNAWWGMYFPVDSSRLLRHPSQLYEAFLEGALLFIILWPVRNKPIFKGKMLPIYLIGYATFRFISEFFREPDPVSGIASGLLTTGQVFSSLLFLGALILLIRRPKASP